MIVLDDVCFVVGDVLQLVTAADVSEGEDAVHRCGLALVNDDAAAGMRRHSVDVTARVSEFGVRPVATSGSSASTGRVSGQGPGSTGAA